MSINTLHISASLCPCRANKSVCVIAWRIRCALICYITSFHHVIIEPDATGNQTFIGLRFSSDFYPPLASLSHFSYILKRLNNFVLNNQKCFNFIWNSRILRWMETELRSKQMKSLGYSSLQYWSPWISVWSAPPCAQRSPPPLWTAVTLNRRTSVGWSRDRGNARVGTTQFCEWRASARLHCHGAMQRWNIKNGYV